MTVEANGITIRGPKGEEIFLHDGSAIDGARSDVQPEYDAETVQRFSRFTLFNKGSNGKLTRKLTVSFNCMHDE